MSYNLKMFNHTSLNWAHPLVREWFISKFGSPTEPQEQGWPHILAGRATLISAPTGSGKTFAAFLICIDKLFRDALDNKLEDKTQVLYVSPLKALNNDIQKNLIEPLNEIVKLAESKGYSPQLIRTAVRTGDTLAKDRQNMLKKPPHILITTPESLFILLTAQKSRTLLHDVKTVIVDEIHALANNKRGTHLFLSLERLELLTPSSFTRIGLSATQKPLDTVGHILVGNERPAPIIIHIDHSRHFDLAIQVPKSELSAVASNEMWDELYDRLAELIKEHHSTLIFVNTRRLSERVAHHLAERIGENFVAAHHGSLSRKIRLKVETQLKNGELKALVATASLELGIDIGTIDLVCQIGSPRAISIALQRVGRAGHWRGAISKGRFFATTRDELLECAALVKAIENKELDQLIIPHEPLDILTQQIIAMCATEEWHEEKLFFLVKKAFPYEHLSRETFDAIITMLSEGISGTRNRYLGYLFRDRVNGIVKARRNARLTAITSGGAIPDNGLFIVVAEPENNTIGTLDEDFAIESHRGDIILLGSSSWQIQRIESHAGRVLVTDAHGAPPTVPFWQGEAPARTHELSFFVSELREKLSQLNPEEGIIYLQKYGKLTDYGAHQLVNYIKKNQAILGHIPTQNTIIAERFFDESGGMQLIIHSPFGARINKAWGLALRKKFCRSFNFELQAAATDNGINISLTEQHSFPLSDVFHFLHPNTIQDVLVQAVLQSPLFTTRWRWTASRALALARFRNGKKVPPNILRMLSEDLLAAVFPDAAACQDNLAGNDIVLPDHPLIIETMKDALNEALDIQGLTDLLKKIVTQSIHCLAVDTPIPSPLAHEILNANPYAFLDDAPLEERRARAVQMRQTLPDSALRDIGKLDPRAIKEVQDQAWPDIRDADELQYALQLFIIFPITHAKDEWYIYFDKLIKTHRVGIGRLKDKKYWFSAEKFKTVISIYPDIIIDVSPANIDTLQKVQDYITRDEDILDMLRGWLLHLGPTTAEYLHNTLTLPISEIEEYLIRLENTGFVLRGHFLNSGSSRLNSASCSLNSVSLHLNSVSSSLNSENSSLKSANSVHATDSNEWCERRLLSRIHRLTLNYLRNEIAAVSPEIFFNWLLGWQHLLHQTQVSGEQGLIEVIKQLQGFEISANAWEPFIFSKRVKDYTRSMLDILCLTGVIGWGRLTTHPALSMPEKSKRISPTSITPITFFLRENVHWIKQQNIQKVNLENLHHIAFDVYTFLKTHGASFFTDIVTGTNHLKAEIEIGLWELVSAGLVTADSFDNLRALIDPKRRLNKIHRRIKPLERHGSSRWSLLNISNSYPIEKILEENCWLLLKRYGIVFRDLLEREKLVFSWRELLPIFRQLENKGEIRGGRFVHGFIGEQFALPYALESLRTFKKVPHTDEKISISTIDPLNLYGIILPGNKFAKTSRKIIMP